MESRKFYLNIIWRIIILTVTIIIAGFIPRHANYLYSIATIAGIIILQTYLLIQYIHKQRKLMSRMLSYIRDSNPTLFFSRHNETPFRELGDFLNEIGEIVRDVRIEKESQLHYMKHITDHLPVGLIAFDKYGSVEFINPEARKMTGMSNLKNIGGLEKAIPGFGKLVTEHSPGEAQAVTMNRDNTITRLSLKCSDFQIGERRIKIVSMQDIGSELDQKEMEAWQKLIRILTHEIINSVTPITSLSSAISGVFAKGESTDGSLTENQVERITTGLGYIEERGRGLIDFVNRYRSLTKIPEPKYESVDLVLLAERVRELKKEDGAKAGITITVAVNTDDHIAWCDETLTEHAVINLVNNAIEAFEDFERSAPPSVEISVYRDSDSILTLSVKDNGKGINPAIEEDIFTPFFTTKQDGSGIGLSLSRQVMRKQGGTITIAPASKGGTIFMLKFPALIPGRIAN